MNINKITIAYMSPTGGTLLVANAIYDAFVSQGIYPAMYDYIKPRSRSVVHQLKEDELLFFISPTYFGRMPSCLEDFSGLRGRRARAFIISTYGNRATGDQPREIASMLSKKGFLVAGFAEIVVRHSLDDELGRGRPDCTDIEDIKNNIQKVFSLLQNDALTVPYPFDLSTPFTSENLSLDVPVITGDVSLCQKCALCVKFCPCGIIDRYTFEVPEAKKAQCMHCTSCIHHCPHHIRDLRAQDKEKIENFFTKVKQQHLSPKINTFHIQRI